MSNDPTALDDKSLDHAIEDLRTKISANREQLGLKSAEQHAECERLIETQKAKLARFEAEQLKRSSDFGK
jgi:hypothetical protein